MITGVRGSGKTALLSDIRIKLDSTEVIALYVVPNEVILDSVLVQLYRQLPKSINSVLPEFKGISANVGASVSFEKNRKKPYFTETFSWYIMEIMDICMKEGKHIVFLIDEAQKHTEDMRVFITTYQDLVMREYRVSMVLAGLPSVVSDILNDDVLTFLRRAKQVELENVDLMIVEHEFNRVFSDVHSSLPGDMLTKAARATFGYPYLIQLIGYYLWEDIHGGEDVDILEDVLFKSKTEMYRNVHKLIFSGLSNMDREFLFAMTEDEGSSSVSSIGERLMKKKSYISLYRERLISAGVIRSCGYGTICFNYPYMKDFLLSKKQEGY